MISYLRRNMVAFVALFVAIILSGGSVAYAANTVRSSDIVDGQVQNQDIAANSIGTGKIQDGSVLGADIKDGSLGTADIKDDSLTGADINESTLGPVPSANALQGASLGNLLDMVRHTTKTAADPTHQCVTPGVWSECGRIPLDVPAGHTYTVTIWSSVTAATLTGSQSAYSCPAITGPTCIDSRAEYIRFIPNMETNVASSATVNLSAGHYDLSTAVLFPDPIVDEPNVNTVTTVEYYDAGF